MDDVSMFFNFFIFMIFFIIILSIAFLFTKFVAKRGKNMLSGKHLVVMDNLSLGLDKQIQLVKVGNKFLVLSIVGKNLQMLTELSTDDFEEIPKIDKPKESDKFNSILGKYSNFLKGNKKSEFTVGDDNKIKRINYNVEKIKSLRNIIYTNDNIEDEIKDEKENEI